MFKTIATAYLSGLVIKDFMWFVVNPVVKLSEFNSKFANFYPWVKLGTIEMSDVSIPSRKTDAVTNQKIPMP